MHRIEYVDSHTGGEPTRVVTAGFPDLGGGDMAERLARFRARFDRLRSAIVCEPRGSDALVGALLTRPVHADSCAGAIFFNNVGYLGMCGHGTIGVIRTLAHLGRIAPGRHRLETPVGTVAADLDADGRVTIDNVESYRYRANVAVDVEGHGPVVGDVAWGGNWFFITDDAPLPLDLTHWRALTDYSERIRRALAQAGVTGADGAEIDHIELNAPSDSDSADARNFVLCPGLAYDRSPCGTGTSAKLACLAADGKLAPGARWRQASIVGSVFEATYSKSARGVRPRITGTAHVTAEGRLLIDPADPFAYGVRADSPAAESVAPETIEEY